MKRNDIVLGGLLTGVGVLLLLENVGLLGPIQDWFWALLLAVGGAAFLGLFITNRTLWWPLIPAFVCFGLSAVIGLEALVPGAAWSGSLFLASIGLGFWAVYVTHPKHWWAIIPGGVLLTLAVVAGLDTMHLDQSYGGGVFFLGLATTFFLVYVLPTPPNRMRWALIPVVVCGVLGLFTLTASTAALDYVWPAALIGAGVYLMVRTYRVRTTLPTTNETQPLSRMEDHYDQPTLPQSH